MQGFSYSHATDGALTDDLHRLSSRWGASCRSSQTTTGTWLIPPLSLQGDDLHNPPAGKPAPCRVLKATDGKSVALSNYEGKKPVVLFFYPRAATPGCTREACAFRDAYGKFKDAGAEVFGISSDTVDANGEFAKVGSHPPSSLHHHDTSQRGKVQHVACHPFRSLFTMGLDVSPHVYA